MNGRSPKIPSVADIVDLMEELAPLSLAEEWDNCGLQIGHPDWTVEKIWVSLDPLYEVVASAAVQQVDLLITHHPLFFKPVKTIDVSTPLGKVVAGVIASKTAVYAAHTNLDSAREGVNEILARKIGLTGLEAMIPAQPKDESQPAALGLGRIGLLPQPTTLGEFAETLKKQFNLKTVKVTGSLEKSISRAAVCSGSGGSLLEHFFQSGADVYISGDIRYHEARTIEDRNSAVIDIGHFASEHIMIDALVDQLRAGVRKKGYQTAIEPCNIERDPFAFI